MSRKSKPAIWIEYLAARGVMGLFRLMPARVAWAVARGLGTLAYFVVGRRRRDGLRNLDLAYGDDLSAAEKRRLIRRVFQHLALVAAEMIKTPQLLTRDTVDDYVECDKWDIVPEALAAGRGVLFLSVHMGNWELLGQSASLKGIEMVSIARALDNPLLDKLVNERREQYGQKIVYNDEALRPMLKVLKEGGTLSFLVDQNARHGHVFVDFFGHPAATTRAVAQLALRNETPILLAVNVRVGPGFRYKIAASGPICPKNTGDKEEDIRRITQEFTAWFEQRIREHPEQWLWLHRRWKTQPQPDARPE